MQHLRDAAEQAHAAEGGAGVGPGLEVALPHRRLDGHAVVHALCWRSAAKRWPREPRNTLDAPRSRCSRCTHSLMPRTRSLVARSCSSEWISLRRAAIRKARAGFNAAARSCAAHQASDVRACALPSAGASALRCTRCTRVRRMASVQRAVAARPKRWHDSCVSVPARRWQCGHRRIRAKASDLQIRLYRPAAAVETPFSFPNPKPGTQRC